MSSSSSLSLHRLYYDLGSVQHQQGQLDAAAKSYYQALSLQQSAVDAGNQRGERFKEPVVHPHDRLKVYNNLGCVLIQQQRWKEAVIVYQQAIQLQPQQAVLHCNLGRVLFRDDPMQAIAAYRRAIQLQPTFGLAHYNLGLALQHQNQHQAALECFQQALRLEPEWVKLHSDCAISWIALGEFERMLNSLRQAILPSAAVIEAYSQSIVVADDHLSLAKASCGRFLQKLLQQVAYSDLIQDLAQTYWHWAKVLTAYGGTEQYRRAEAYYQIALKLQPQNLDLVLDLADCLVHQSRLNAAVLIYQTALARYPDQSQIYSRLGVVLEQQQQFDSAISCYQTALRFNPQVPAPLNLTPPTQTMSRLWGLTQDWLRDRHLTESYVALEMNLEVSLGSQVADHQEEQSVDDPALDLAEFRPTLETVIPEARTSAAETCAGLNCDRCLKQIWNWFNPIHLGKGLYVCPSQAAIPVAPYPLFVATIPQGKSWIVPQQNAWMVCNAVAVLGDDIVLSDLSRAYPAQLPGCDNFDQKFDPLLAQATAPRLEQITGRVAVLSTLSGNTYFHWMVDLLPRIELLQQRMDLKCIDWFLVNSIQHPFQVETLKMLGIPLERVIASDQHPYIQATELIVPSFSSHFGWLEPWALAFLRRSFLDPVLDSVLCESVPVYQKTLNDSVDNLDRPADCLDRHTAFPKRIYVSRSEANHRRILNEPEVLERLQSFGFVAVELETLSFQEQVALFAHAEVIITPHGSGLTNLIFSRPNTTVVELVSPHYIRHYYWVISRLLSLKHYFLVGEALPCHLMRELMYQNPLIEDIWVNLDALAVMLETLNLTAIGSCPTRPDVVPVSQRS